MTDQEYVDNIQSQFNSQREDSRVLLRSLLAWCSKSENPLPYFAEGTDNISDSNGRMTEVMLKLDNVETKKVLAFDMNVTEEDEGKKGIFSYYKFHPDKPYYLEFAEWGIVHSVEELHEILDWLKN